ncbi:MAG: zinc ribbon domain-containing protein [Acidobacteriaceae bacterium]
MDLHCHRCGTLLSPASPFCPQCGAPQLYCPSYESAELIPGSSGDEAGFTAHGRSLAASVHVVDWRAVVNISLVVAAIAGGLCILAFVVPPLSIACFFWVISCSLITIRLYQRKVTPMTLDAGMGARIGMIAGLLTAFSTMTVNAITMVIQRYALHMGATFDAQLTASIHQAMTRAAENNPDVQIQSFLSFWLSPEGRAGLVLATAAMLVAGIVVLAVVSGALAAKMFPARRRPAL